MWVLAGTFASLLWLLISLFEEDKYFLDSAIFLSIFVYIIYYSSKSLFKYFSSLFSKDKSRFIYLRSFMANSLPNFILSVATLIFIYVYSVRKVEPTSSFQTILLTTAFILIMIVFLLMILISFINIPVDINNTSPTSKKTRAITMIVFVLLAINYLSIIYSQLPEVDDYSSIKVGLVLFALHFVTIKLLSSFEKNTLLNQIDDLLDDVSFDNKSIEEGESTLKLIIIGLQLKMIFAPLINEHLELTKLHNENLNLMIERLKEIEHTPDTKQRNLLLDAIDSQVSKLETILLSIVSSKKKIIKKLSFYLYSNLSDPEFNNVQSILTKLASERDEKLSEFRRHLKILRDKL